VAEAKLALTPKQSLLWYAKETFCNLLFVKARSLTFAITILVDACKVATTERMD
jgi:hypothetical protein